MPENRMRMGGYDLSREENLVYSKIPDDPVHIDTLIKDCGLPAAGTMSYLLRLELKRLVKQLPGKKFVRVAS